MDISEKVTLDVLKVFVFSSLFLYGATLISSQPGFPHQFYGSVSCNGGSAPDGLRVSVYYGNEEYSHVLTSGGSYGHNPVFLVSGLVNGSNIGFYVDGELISQTTFGSRSITNLDLVYTHCQSGAQGGDGGSSGGSSGGGSSSNNNQEEPVEDYCSEKWECNEWSGCMNGIKIRSCVDLNGCGTEIMKPSLEDNCDGEVIKEDVNEEVKEEEERRNLIVPLGASIGLVIILSFLLVVYFRRKSKNI